MGNFNMIHRNTLLTCLAVIISPISVSAEILIGSNNAEAAVGETITLNCSSNLKTVIPSIEWHHYPVGQLHEVVYKSGFIYRGYRGRYNVLSGSESTDFCNLVIKNVTLDDAGKFICMESDDEKSQKETELIVFTRYPSDGFCRIDYQLEYFAELSCEMEYRGNIIPSMEWMDLLGNVVNSSTNTVAGITTSALRLTKDQIRNSYSCQTQYKGNELVSRYKWFYSYAMLGSQFNLTDESSTSNTNAEPENQPTKAKTFVIVALLVGLLVIAGILALLMKWIFIKYRKRSKDKNQEKTGVCELKPLKERKVVVLGLDEGERITQEMYEFNLHRPNKFSFLESVPTEIQISAVAVTYEDQLFLIGIGKDLEEIWKYERNSAWTKCADLKQGRRRHCETIVETTLYVSGGCHPRTDEVLKSVEAYNLLDSKCSHVGELVHAVQFSACAASKGLIYVFGGLLKEERETDCVQIYDTRYNRCSLFSKPMPSPQTFLRALSWNNSVILINCWTCFIFDFEKEIWREMEQFKTDVKYFGLVHDDEKVFVFGGGMVERRDTVGKLIWKCRDEIKCVLLEDIINDKKVKWEECGRLPKPSLIDAYS